MDRREAIITLRANVIYACESAGFNVATINLVTEALDLAIEALEREIEYGQMVVDYTKGEALKSDNWGYTNISTDTPTNDCISRQQAIEEIKNATTITGWNEDASQEEIVDDVERQLRRLFVGAIESLPPVTPPKRVVAEIKVDTEELVERIKEEYQTPVVSEDCISREWVLNLYKEWQPTLATNVYEFGDALKNAPSVTPTVSEDCISREQARAKLDYISYAEKDPITIAKRIVEDAPSVVPSREKGEWIEDEYYGYPYYVCSNCGQECGTQNNGVEIEPLCTKYCPNCGAKMEVTRNE